MKMTGVGTALMPALCVFAISSAYAQTAGGAERVAEPSAGSETQAAPPAATGELTEIIVTALKQNRTVLTSPASIAIVTPEVLSVRGITTANQLDALVPGVVMGTGASGVSSAFVRGLGTNAPIFSVELSVPMYIDGVYYGHGRDTMTPVYDLDRVEIIRGTQATLLGKNSSLGAITYWNCRPAKDWQYGLTYTRNLEFDGDKVEGTLNAPLSDQFQARVSFLALDQEGVLRNNFTGNNDQTEDQVSGRLSLAYQPTDWLDATLIYQHDERDADGQNMEVLKDPSGRVRTWATAAGQTNFNGTADHVSSSASDPMGGVAPGPEAFDDMRANRVTGIVDIDLGQYTLTAQAAYVDVTSDRSNDLDFTAANLLNLVETETNEIFSQEIRLASPQRGRLSYLVGVYYYNNQWRLDRLYDGEPANTVGFPLTGFTHGDTSIETDTISVFGSATIDLTQALALTLGGRYTQEDKKVDIERSGSGVLNGAFPPIAATSLDLPKDKPFDYNASLEYTQRDGLMYYAAYSRSSKSGGFQEFPTTLAGGPFEAEKTYTAEVGVKARLGSSSHLTVALFDTRVDGFQTSFTQAIGGVSQTVIGNSNVESYGVDIAGTFGIGGGFSVDGGVVYADSFVRDDFPSATGAIAHNGDRLVRAPKWSGNLSLNFKEVSNRPYQLVGGLSLSLSSSFLNQFERFRPDAPESGDYTLLGANFGLRSRDAGWEVSLLGSNLLNESYVTFATPVSATGGVGTQAYYGTLNRPREVSIQFRINR